MITEDYQWDGLEEYNGWLQYRWGDHRNAANLIRNRKKPDISKVYTTETESERLQHKFDVELNKNYLKIDSKRTVGSDVQEVFITRKAV